MAGLPSTLPQTGSGQTASGTLMNALGSEVPAVRDEFLGDQRVLAEVQVHIAGQQIGPHEALIADDIALGIRHPVGRTQRWVLVGDVAPGKLVPSLELALR